MRIPAAYLLVCLVTLGAAITGAAAPTLGVTDAWLRATPGIEVAAVYLTLRNTGATPITVVSVRSPLAQTAMIHETQLVGTQSTMRAHEELTLAPGQTLHFVPGGLHVMLHRLSHALRPGEEVPLELLLKSGATVKLVALVRPLGQE